MQHYLGSSEDFFYSKFRTKKDPDDLAEFYQAEDLLKIIAIHPFFFNLFMNKVDPDTAVPTKEAALLSVEETHFRVKLLGMEVSFEIMEKEETVNGETKLTSFMRHERFIDWVPVLADFGYKILLWDQTWTYGFNRLDDGSIEVYHHGEKFRGPWPIRLIVFVHQYYVCWACEKYINGDAFGTEDIDKQQEELACMPLHVFHEFIAKLQAEKARSLQELQNEAVLDTKAISETSEALQKLSDLSRRDKSSISVVKRQAASGSVAGQVALKIVTEDAATQDALASAMKDSKGSTDSAVKGAMKEALRNPDLEFKERPKSVKKPLPKSS